MNTKILRKAIISIPAVLLLFLSGCLKTHDGFIDFSKTSDFVILTGAGLVNFKSANIQVNTASTDTIKKTITVDLASANNNSGVVTVTIGVNNNLITTYNTANGTNFQPFPANAYKIINNKITVPAGQHYGTTTIEIYQNKLDPTISYMLPVSITDGGGKQLSSNQNTIYYNVIGNPIAGPYTQEWIRWNAPDSSGTPTYDLQFAATFAPVSPTTISVDSGSPLTYLLSFTNTNGVLSNFKLSFDPASVTAAAAGGITITSGPTIEVADPANHHFRFTFNYSFNGAPRVIVDDFH